MSDVDNELKEELSQGLGEAVESIVIEERGRVETATWHEIIARCSLLVSRMEQNRFVYMQKSSRATYDWAMRSAYVLRDIFLAMAQTDPDMVRGFRAFWTVRDFAMAEQLNWIMEREGPEAKFVVAAHNAHFQRYPVRVQKGVSMGSYITERIGRENTLFIGTASAHSVKGDEPHPKSNQAVYDCIGPDCFFLDLRNAPSSGPVAEWLQVERLDRHNLRYNPLAPGPAWDCLLFHRTLAIANVALPPSLIRGRVEADASRFDDYVGRYQLLGFLAQPTDLSITREGDSLFADGQEDTSGELFPPTKTQIEQTDDGRFAWPNWPALLEFHSSGPTEQISITMPGMGVYAGTRIS